MKQYETEGSRELRRNFESNRTIVQIMLGHVFEEVSFDDEQIESLKENSSPTTRMDWPETLPSLRNHLMSVILDPAAKAITDLQAKTRWPKEELGTLKKAIISRTAALELTTSVYKTFLPPGQNEVTHRVYEIIEKNIAGALKKETCDLFNLSPEEFKNKIEEAKTKLPFDESPGYEFFYPPVH